jgi:predicted DNA-binding transcriptional regulator AlpA
MSRKGYSVYPDRGSFSCAYNDIHGGCVMGITGKVLCSGSSYMVSRSAERSSQGSRYVTVDELSKTYSLTGRWFYKQIALGNIPAPIKFGKKSSRWDADEVHAAMMRMSRTA